MKRALLLIAVLAAVVAASGCAQDLNDGTTAPTLGPMPTADPLPTAEPIPTAEPLPTPPGFPSLTPSPQSADDPIIGSWTWYDANYTPTTYTFDPDGTFQRIDGGDDMTVYNGIWEYAGDDTYNLTYSSGLLTETITYHPSAHEESLENNQTIYTRS